MPSSRKYTGASLPVQESAAQENFPVSPDNAELPQPRECRIFSIANLRVDHTYQHHEYSTAVGDLLKRFSYARCGYILVSVREDDEEIGWILDGQIRTACCERLGIRHVEAEIVRNLTRIQEAEWYIDKCILTKRKPVDRFQAECTAKHADSVALHELLTEKELVVVPHEERSSAQGIQYQVTCVDALKRMLRQEGGRYFLGEALDLIRDTWPDDSRALTSLIIAGVFDLLKEYNEKVDSKSFVAHLEGYSIAELHNAANALRLAKTPMPKKQTALKMKMIELYDLGLPQNRRLVRAA